jgi:hypothetical protein
VQVPRLGEENAAADAGQLSAEEMGRRVASRWTHDEVAVGDVQLEEERRKDDEKEEREREIREEQEKYGVGGEEEGLEEGSGDESVGEDVEDLLEEEDVAQPEASKGELEAELKSVFGSALHPKRYWSWLFE